MPISLSEAANLALAESISSDFAMNFVMSLSTIPDINDIVSGSMYITMQSTTRTATISISTTANPLDTIIATSSSATTTTATISDATTVVSSTTATSNTL